MAIAVVPPASETAASLQISDEQAVGAYRSLAEAHVYVLEPGDPTRLRMANPFSAVPTRFAVEVSGNRYFGNCIWDGLGIVWLMGGTGQVSTRCPDCGEGLTVDVTRGALVGEDGIVHFSVPAAHWWDDIIYT
ncbi:MAG: alkylmercury lyase family protein [Candidatus Dormibacteraeota bacterium]|nr:alkylmercury lyase family protein [Candidatus Dormibacteraeota bacterium]